jgi:hypothetical protein
MVKSKLFDRRSKLFDRHQDIDSSARQVELLSEIASGLQFFDDGSLVAVNGERRSELTQQLKDLAQDLRTLIVHQPPGGYLLENAKFR